MIACGGQHVAADGDAWRETTGGRSCPGPGTVNGGAGTMQVRAQCVKDDRRVDEAGEHQRFSSWVLSAGARNVWQHVEGQPRGRGSIRPRSTDDTLGQVRQLRAHGLDGHLEPDPGQPGLLELGGHARAVSPPRRGRPPGRGAS